MSLISVSSPAYSLGEEVARGIAARLGYLHIDDDDVLRAAAERSGVPAAKLRRAFREAPSLFGMSRVSRRVCAVHVRAALASYFLKDKIVYSGPFGPHMIHDVSHLLRVRIRGDLADRIARARELNGRGEEDARRSIRRHDTVRSAVAEVLFGRDDDDGDLFDLTFSTSAMDVETIVDAISEAMWRRSYRPMTYSISRLAAEDLATRITASLLDLDSDVSVRVVGGHVEVKMRNRSLFSKRKARIARERVSRTPGVKEVKIEVVEEEFSRIVGGCRLR